MVPGSVRSILVALGLSALALPAAAQQTQQGQQAQQGPQAEGQPSQQAPAASAGPAGRAAPGGSAEPERPVVPAAGYAYSDKPRAASRSVPKRRYRVRGPAVNMPGFEQTADGSRLFVELSATVPVEERKAKGSITYVLKGASPRVWNNTNALVTVHFNTPVSRARLVPHGKDLHFVVELRAAVTPTWEMKDAGDKGATLSISFPKGDFLPAPAEAAPAAAGKDQAPAQKGPRGPKP